MTFRDAWINGVERIRKPFWNEFAYLELPPTCNGLRGSWCTLVDHCSAIADPSLERLPIASCMVDNDEFDWELFTDDRP